MIKLKVDGKRLEIDTPELYESLNYFTAAAFFDGSWNGLEKTLELTQTLPDGNTDSTKIDISSGKISPERMPYLCRGTVLAKVYGYTVNENGEKVQYIETNSAEIVINAVLTPLFDKLWKNFHPWDKFGSYGKLPKAED